MSEHILEVRHLSKSFGSHDVLTDIDFTVNAGDVTSIIGASGSGKSTLLRCINLLEAFLLEESGLEDSPVLRLTHEKIASHMGTAREVITRMLRYFQEEGMVSLSRGTITIQDPERLARLQE